METNEMSSEEVTEQVTEEATNTEEAKVTPAEEPTVPLHQHTALRNRAQKAELAQAEMRGKLSAMEQIQTKQAPAPISPIDAFIQKELDDGVEANDIQIPAMLHVKERQYDKQVANQLTENDAANRLQVTQLASANASSLIHDDWEEVRLAGQALLTKGEFLDVTSAGEGYGELAYAKCKAAIERNKPVEKTEAAPKKEPSELKEEVKEKVVVPTQDELLAGISETTRAVMNM